MFIKLRPNTFLGLCLSSFLISCSIQPKLIAEKSTDNKHANNFFIVDCLLPGQIKRLGQGAMYTTARRPIKTSSSQCEIRGGEYVSYDRADLKTALRIWLPQAVAGNSEAQTYVGEMYEKGLGVLPNYLIARKWYEKAAAQNNTKAQLNLGYLYEKGLGVPKNQSLAMLWYEKASGLEALNIPYSATISSNTDDLRPEVNLLKTELANSRKTAEQLNSQFQKTQQELTQQQINIDQTQHKLTNYVNQLKSAVRKNKSSQVEQLQLMIEQHEVEIQQQKNQLVITQAAYDTNLTALKGQLNITQKRTQQINTELLKNETHANSTQLQLLNTKSLLAKTEAQLLALQQKTQHELQAIRSDKLLAKQQFNKQQSQTEYQLNFIQLQLIQQQREKLKQAILLSQLQQENKQYQQQIPQLKLSIKQAKASNGQTHKINQELVSVKNAASKSQQKAKEMQQSLLATEKKLKTLALNSKAALIAALSDANNSEQTIRQQQQKLLNSEQRLKEYEHRWKQQQQLTKQILNEKNRYQTKLKQLNKSANLSAISSRLSIEIIDPPFSIIRGIKLAKNIPTVKLRSLIKTREVFGKVSSSTGLLALLINDKKTQINQQGIFKANIKLTKNETPVSIVAIDNSGKRASLDFVFSLNEVKNEKILSSNTQQENFWKSLDFGRYHALIIGNNDYQKVASLDTPINDAIAVEQVLKEKYAFNSITVLKNATRYEILSALNKLRANLTAEDNLLIYYAGHGELDKANMRGHWLPVDADADNTANWISTVAITDILNAMSANHVLVVSDSCYSGAMTRSSLARIDAGVSQTKKHAWLKAMLKTRSRTVLTSGGLKPVMDGGGGKHSVFAKAFIDALRENTSLLEGQQLYRQVSGGIIKIASKYGIEQVPEYAPIRHAGHESGEFFLIPKN